MQHWNDSSPTFLQKGSSHSSACFLYQDLDTHGVCWWSSIPAMCSRGLGGCYFLLHSLKFLAISIPRTLQSTKHTKPQGIYEGIYVGNM